MAKVYPHLEMHQTFGKIAIQTQKASQTIRQPKADLSIQQPHAEMSVKRQPAKVQIDQTEAWHNLDLKSAIVRNKEAAAAGIQAALEGTARRASEGNELLHIERNKGKNIFAQLAAKNTAASVIGTHYDTGHTPPFQAVRIQVTPASLQVDWKENKPIIRATPNRPEVTYNPGDVTISMQQYPSLDIHAVGLYVDERG